MKIVINTCYGGFGLSKEFKEKYPNFNDSTERDNPKFIKALEEFGLENAGDEYADLEIIELKEGVTDWLIEDDDGCETLVFVQNGKLHFH